MVSVDAAVYIVQIGLLSYSAPRSVVAWHQLLRVTTEGEYIKLNVKTTPNSNAENRSCHQAYLRKGRNSVNSQPTQWQRIILSDSRRPLVCEPDAKIPASIEAWVQFL